MFWLRIRPNDIDNNGANHQYIISSGGQVESARGFSFLYAKEESKFKLQIQTTANVYMAELASLPENWFHFAFTFKKGKKSIIIECKIIIENSICLVRSSATFEIQSNEDEGHFNPLKSPSPSLECLLFS